MSIRCIVLAALLGAAPLAVATPALAAPPGVAELLKQADFWRGKGREDLARQALNRVLQIDPGNVDARTALNGPTPTPALQPPVQRDVTDDAEQLRRAEPARHEAPTTAADPAGRARAAGFAALDNDDLATAASRFQSALRLSPHDTDVMGGLGIVRLRAKKFGEARDLLERASSHGDGAKWASALRAARFYAGLDEARAAMAANQFPRAEQIARALAADDDKNGSAMLLLGDIMSREGRNGDAASIYEQAGAAGNVNAGLIRARLAQEQAAQAVANGDVLGAVSGYQSAIAQSPSDPWLRYAFANFLLDQNHPADAATVMGPLATTTEPDALYAAALFAKRATSPMNAAALMAQIPPASLTPEMKAFLVDLKMGEASDRVRELKESGNIAGALQGAHELAASPHATVETLGAVADLMIAMGDIAGATTAAERAVSLPLAEPEAYQSIISVLARNGHDLEAAGLLAKLGNKAPVSPALGRLFAILAANRADRMRLAGQNAAAFDVLRAAWSNAPQDRDILAALGRLYLSGGMPGQAEQVYAMLIGQKADDLSAQIGLADAASAAHDFARAQATVAIVLRLAPHNPDTYMAAARFEEARGNKGAALRYLKQARAIDTTGPALAGSALPGANPFVASSDAGNPFTAAQPAVPANPFALPSRPIASASEPRPVYATTVPTGFAQRRASEPSFTQASYSPDNAPAYSGAAASESLLTTNMPADQASLTAAPPPGENPFGGHVPSASDPTLARIDREIDALSGDTGPAIGASVDYRSRSGEAGLSKLDEIDASVYASAQVGRAKITATASPVVLDSGTASSSGSARFGTNATAEAEGIVAAEPSKLVGAGAQHDAGVAATLGVEAGAFKADGGITPIGFQKTNVQGGASFTPKITDHLTVGIHAERRPETDSMTSYAGSTDPVTGKKWGSVMKTGGGGSVSYDDHGSGIYADASYHHEDGENVRSNHDYEANLGAYLNAFKSDSTSLTVGGNLNYQSYQNNQNEFTFGNGGYFSPKSFVSVALPIRFKTTRGKWQIAADLSPGFQSYQQDQTDLYPTMPAAQAELVSLKAADNDVRATYDSLSKTGFAFDGKLSAYYQLSDSTRIGGETSYNSFGVYKEFRTMLSIRQSLGAGGQ